MLHTFRHFILAGCLVLAGQASLHAQVGFSSGTGLLYLEGARTLPRGMWLAAADAQYYYTNFEQANLTDIQAGFAASLGVLRGLTLSADARLYQDINLPGMASASPDEIVLSAKWAAFANRKDAFALAIQTAARLPLQDTQNAPFHPYAARKASGGIRGIFSFTSDPMFPLHANDFMLTLGYWHHNDNLAVISENATTQIVAIGAAQEVLYGLGWLIRGRRLDISAELNGNFFLRQPSPAAFAREPYLFFSPGAYLKLTSGLTAVAGLDVRLYEGADETVYALNPPPFPTARFTYPSFRLQLGLRLSGFLSRSRPKMREAYHQKDPSFFNNRKTYRNKNFLLRQEDANGTAAPLSEAASREEKRFILWQLRTEGNPFYYLVEDKDERYIQVYWYARRLESCPKIRWELHYLDTVLAQEEFLSVGNEVLSLRIPVADNYPLAKYRLTIHCLPMEKGQKPLEVEFELRGRKNPQLERYTPR